MLKFEEKVGRRSGREVWLGGAVGRGMGGCEQRIEVFVKMQKKVRMVGVGVGRGGGVGWG